MLYELTWTCWASISATKALKGLFVPDSFSFVARFGAEFYFCLNVGMWGDQGVTMEHLAHTALLQPISNYPVVENC